MSKRARVDVDPVIEKKEGSTVLQDIAVETKQKGKKATAEVDERVAESHRKFSAYIASWRQEVYSETQHGISVIRKPSSLPPLSSLPLLLTSEHLSFFGANKQVVAADESSSNVLVNTHNKISVKPEISNLVHDFFHSSSCAKAKQDYDKKNTKTNLARVNNEYSKCAPCTGVIFDTAMYSHQSSNPKEYERPLRLQRAIEHLKAVKLFECCTLLPPRLASSRELRRAHSRNLIDYIDRIDFVLAIRASPAVPTPSLVVTVDESQVKESSKTHVNNNNSNDIIIDQKEHTNAVQSLEIGQDLYACSYTSRVARLAAGCAVEAALAV